MHLKERFRMPTQYHLPALPGGAEEINSVVAIIREHGQVAYFASGVPLFVHAENDAVGRRIAAAQLMELGLARQDELSAALGVHRSTLYRQHRQLTTRACWAWWTTSVGRAAPIASRPTCVSGSCTCWARVGRSARRRNRWASPKERFATPCAAGN